MKTILSSLLILLVPAAITKAATLTVDNRPGSNAMYANFPEAYAAANDGDTILIAGSSSGYSGGSVYKRLTIIGSGFLHNENGIPGVNPQRVSLSLDLRNDALLGSASGTTLIGIDGLLTVHPNLTGITIDKCRSAQFDLRSPVSITRCYDASSITFGSGSSGSVIRNSIVRSLVFNTTGINADRLVITSGFSGDPSTSISNSIFVFTSAGNFTRDSTSVSNCMAVGFDTLPAGGGNINGQLVNNVFLNTGSDDGKWRLKAGSPALGAGTDGSDMGAFGGPAPYVLSGIPGVPRITRIVTDATATSTSGLRLEVDAQGFAE